MSGPVHAAVPPYLHAARCPWQVELSAGGGGNSVIRKEKNMKSRVRLDKQRKAAAAQTKQKSGKKGSGANSVNLEAAG